MTLVDQWLNSAGTGRNGVPPHVSGVPPPEIAVPPPKVVVPVHQLVMTFRHHLGENLATSGQIFRLKCTNYVGWGSAPDPAVGDYSVRPETLAGRGANF